MSHCWNGPFWASGQNHGNGGVVLFISDFVQSCFVGHGFDPYNICVWVTIFLHDNIVGFYSIYTPNTSDDSNTLWDQMVSSFPHVEYILGGNFHVVEWDRDRDGVGGSIIDGVEKCSSP
jgi:hypothetical protein